MSRGCHPVPGACLTQSGHLQRQSLINEWTSYWVQFKILNKKALWRTHRQRPRLFEQGSNLPKVRVTSAAPLQDRTASSSSGVWLMLDKLLLLFFSGTTTSAKQEWATGWTFCNAWVRNWKWTCTTVRKHRPNTCENKSQAFLDYGLLLH